MWLQSTLSAWKPACSLAVYIEISQVSRCKTSTTASFLYMLCRAAAQRGDALRRMHHHAAKIQNILYLQALWQKNLHLKLGLVVTKGCPKFVDALTSPRRRIDEPPSTHRREPVVATRARTHARKHGDSAQRGQKKNRPIPSRDRAVRRMVAN